MREDSGRADELEEVKPIRRFFDAGSTEIHDDSPGQHSQLTRDIYNPDKNIYTPNPTFRTKNHRI